MNGLAWDVSVITRRPALIARDLGEVAERLHEYARDIEARARMIGVRPNSDMADLFTIGERKWLRYCLNSATLAVEGVTDAIGCASSEDISPTSRRFADGRTA